MNASDPKLAAIERFFAAYADGDRDGIAAVLADGITWSIPGHHPLSGTKHGVDEVLSFFDQLAKVGFKADTIFLGVNEEVRG